MRKKRILFIFLIPSSFVIKDVQILRAHFDVKTVDFVLRRKNPLGTFKTIFSMIWGILWADLTFSWFINIHAFWAVRLSKLFRKKSVVVIGGFEVAKIPEINYGLMIHPKSACIVKYVINTADKVLAVSKFSKQEILKYAKSANVELIYNGVDWNTFKATNEKEELVITVGNTTKDSCKLKGIDTFVKASKGFPELKFIVIGHYEISIVNRLKQISQNVEFVGSISHDEVACFLRKAKVYCQLSYRESFGMALAEAMLCECVPVVTNRGALPEIVGNTGFYVPYGDVEKTSEKIKEALKSERGKDARERIIRMFPEEKREKELVKIIKEVLHGE